MTDYPGAHVTGGAPLFAEFPGRTDLAYTRGPQQQGAVEFASLRALATPGDFADAHVSVPHRAAPTPTDYPGIYEPALSLDPLWFEIVHVIPRVIAFGNIVTQQDRGIEIYSAYRFQAITFDSWTNPVDPGLSIPDLPSLPETIDQQSALNITLRASADGQGTFSGLLTFSFSVGDVTILVSGDRIVLLIARPEQPARERLAFRTNVLRARSGVEQRIRVRKRPRRSYIYRYRLDGRDRQAMHARIFGWGAQRFGVPVWHETLALTADVSSSATVVEVEQTADVEFVVGGLACVYESPQKFDVLVVDTIGASSITFASGLANDYDAGAAEVFPVVVGFLENRAGLAQFIKTLEDFEITIDVTSNDVNLEDVSAWPSLGGKVLFLENIVRGQSVGGVLLTNAVRIDNESGAFEQETTWPHARIGTVLTLAGRSRAGVRNLREVLYALRGRQISFHVATNAADLTPVATLVSAQSTMDVDRFGYARFVEESTARATFRITFDDGTTLTRTITDSAEIDATTERLTLDDSWPSNYDPEDVVGVQFITPTRFDTDVFEIEHDEVGRARVSAPVVADF